MIRYIPRVNAGVISLIIGFTSSAVLVFEAARASGANEDQIVSWFWALGVGIGVLTMGLSYLTKKPIVIAWSTPGAALLITAAAEHNLNQSIGAFVMCAAMISVVGFTGLFGRLMSVIPSSLAAAMLGGILVNFGINIFTTLEQEPVLVTVLLVSYLVGFTVNPRVSVAFALVAGVLFCQLSGAMDLSQVSIELSQPTLMKPAFSMSAFIGLAVPLFVVTMASQNIPGAALMKAYGYKVNESVVIGSTGLVSLVLAPLGGFCFNLAAIMAAICVNEESEPDPKLRYISALWTGLFYFIAGIFAASIVGLMLLFPAALATTIAGIALLSVIANSIDTAMSDESNRLPNIITFLMVASGISIGQVSGAFWGLILGLLVSKLLQVKKRYSHTTAP